MRSFRCYDVIDAGFRDLCVILSLSPSSEILQMELLDQGICIF